jgi:plastocyanin
VTERWTFYTSASGMTASEVFELGSNAARAFFGDTPFELAYASVKKGTTQRYWNEDGVSHGATEYHADMTFKATR